MLSLSAPIKDRSDNEQPSYGIISNAGSLSLVDGTGEIKEYARMGLLTTDLDVSLTLEDTITKKHQSIGKFKTNKWSYDNMNYEVTIELKDDIERLQNIKYSGDPLAGNRTFISIYGNLIIGLSSYGYTIITDGFARSILDNISGNHIYLDSGTYWEQLTKFCDIVGLHIYENENKEIIVYSDFGG